MLTFKGHIHPAVIGDDLVLLDERDGQYLCLPDAGRGLAPHLNRWVIEDPDLAEALNEAGLVEGGVRPRQAALQAARDWSRFTPAAQPWTMALKAWGGASIRFHCARFSTLLRHAQRLRRQCARDDHAAAALSAQFMRVRPWLPAQGLCLQRSFIQLDYLAQAGVKVDWVFGVKTWPFEAHCWLQSGDIALSDHFERTALYEPILVV